VLQRAGWVLPRPFLYLQLFFAIKKTCLFLLVDELWTRDERGDVTLSSLTEFVFTCIKKKASGGKEMRILTAYTAVLAAKV
jgi:hypothetical protein